MGQTTKPLRYRSEVGSYFSTTGIIPFWLRANQYGIVPSEHAIMTLRQSLRVDYHDAPKSMVDSMRATNRRVDWGWGFEGILNAGYDYKLIIPEAYVKLKFGNNIEFWGGRRREIIGLVDSTLSSGSYAWSGNTLPMLKIQLAITDYVPRNGLFSFKGFYAHGWFEQERFINNTLLHQKALYGRFGKPNWRLKLYAGINHEVMWGGNTERLPGSTVKNNQLPNRFSDYMKVVTAQSLANTDDDSTRLSAFDRENRIGNHLGSVDLGFEYTANTFSIFAYRQSIYEDGSLFYLINIQDGLNGIRIRNRRPTNPNGLQIHDILFEYLYTASQGGNVFVETINSQRGRDNYFNHSQYQDGWSRYGLTMGTPFISPTTDSRSNLPRYGFTNNNRVTVLHLGLSGQILDFFRFQFKASYSENLGTYEKPFGRPVRQFSSVFSVSSPLYILNGVTANAAVATDVGELYDNSVGFYIGIRKEGQTKRRRSR
ncbi:capsule assembly Wzi family protein [Spirosoma harenae]